jgi:uncharacterized iron-regulated protein
MQVGLRIIVILCAFALQAATQPTSVDSFIAAARNADIVVLGEIHDNPAHHANQAAIVAALQPAALVLEMIPQAEEDVVNELRAKGAGRDEIAAALDWGASGWPDFAFYAEILEAAPDARVFGAGQPAADVRRAMVEGAAGVFGPDAATYGLDKPLDPADQAAREALQAEAHCGALPATLLPGMVEAQRFRDAGLADAALWARTMTGDGQVVVIAGSGHADKARGVPAALAIADPEVKVLALGQFEAPPSDPQDYDAWLIAPAPQRDDPCASLRSPGE